MISYVDKGPNFRWTRDSLCLNALAGAFNKDEAIVGK